MTTGRSARRLRILAVSREVPRRDISGGDLRFCGLLDLMARRHEVTLCPLIEDGPPADSTRHVARLRASGIRVLRPGWTAGLERALIRRIFDVAIFEFWEVAELAMETCRTWQPWAGRVVDSVDIHFRREAAGLAVGAVAAGAGAEGLDRRKARELATYRAADSVICVSSDDAEALEAEGGVAERPVLPLVVPGRDRPALDRGRGLLFVGGFRHDPNVDGLLWFARRIWPAIRSAVPEGRLTVVGSYPPAEILALREVEGVEVLGQVPRLEPHLDRAAAMVAPLRYGAGMKSKVVEAMASGLAVVTTAVGAQGLGATSGEHLIVADDPSDFARSAVALLRDPTRAEAIGARGRRHIAPICGPEAVAGGLEAALDRVAGRGVPRLSAPALCWSSSRLYARRATSWARAKLRAPLRPGTTPAR